MTRSPFSLALFGDAAAVDLTVALLMLVFGIAIGVGLACLFIVLHTVRRRPGNRVLLRPSEHSARTDGRSMSAGAALPLRWLAIRGNDLALVQRTLRLHQVSPCSWDEGISAANHHLLFLTPPIHGWILVFGTALPDPAADVDSCYLSLARLSRKLGRIQFFSVDYVLGHHAWAMLEEGRVVRAYAWAGKTLWNQGPVTAAELEVGLICHDYGDGEAAGHLGRPTEILMNTQRIQALAGRWSLNPTAVEARLGHKGMGFAGHVSRSKTA